MPRKYSRLILLKKLFEILPPDFSCYWTQRRPISWSFETTWQNYLDNNTYHWTTSYKASLSFHLALLRSTFRWTIQWGKFSFFWFSGGRLDLGFIATFLLYLYEMRDLSPLPPASAAEQIVECAREITSVQIIVLPRSF